MLTRIVVLEIGGSLSCVCDCLPVCHFPVYVFICRCVCKFEEHLWKLKRYVIKRENERNKCNTHVSIFLNIKEKKRQKNNTSLYGLTLILLCKRTQDSRRHYTAQRSVLYMPRSYTPGKGGKRRYILHYLSSSSLFNTTFTEYSLCIKGFLF